MKKIFIILLFTIIYIDASAQNCKVQGVIQYYHNDYLGYRPDLRAEVMFIKYSSTYKIPNRQTWETYQSLVDKWIKFGELRRYFGQTSAYEQAGFKITDKDIIQEYGVNLAVELDRIIEKGLVKYTTIVNSTGMYDISVPYGTYYVLIKSKNRKFPTALELKNRYRMIRVVLNSPTNVISYDFDFLRNAD